MADLTLRSLIAEAMADSLGGVPASVYDVTAGDVLDAIAAAGYVIDRKAAVVKALADADPCETDPHDDTMHWCTLCDAHVPVGPEDHEPTCPWRMAREAVDRG